jgi:RecA/RadA recombinase
MKALRRVQELSSDQQILLANHKFEYCHDIIEKTDIQLMAKMDLTRSEAQELLRIVSKSVVQSMRNMTVLELKRQFEGNLYTHLPSTLSKLNESLRGGIPCGTITEIVGPRASGKTTLLYGLILEVFRTDLAEENGIIFIDSENSFDAKRIMEMAHTQGFEGFNENYLKRVNVINMRTVQDLRSHLNEMEEQIVEKNIKLIVIDSINALKDLNNESENEEERKRGGTLLGQQAAVLK